MTDTTRMQQLRAKALSLKPDRALLSSDLVAALTFAVVNVPQAMGHALLATVNPVLGIFTLMVAVPVGAIFNSSVFMNVSTHRRAVGGRRRRAAGVPGRAAGWRRWSCWCCWWA